MTLINTNTQKDFQDKVLASQKTGTSRFLGTLVWPVPDDVTGTRECSKIA